MQYEIPRATAIGNKEMHNGLRIIVALLILGSGALSASVAAESSALMRPIVLLATLVLLYFFWIKTKAGSDS